MRIKIQINSSYYSILVIPAESGRADFNDPSATSVPEQLNIKVVNWGMQID